MKGDETGAAALLQAVYGTVVSFSGRLSSRRAVQRVCEEVGVDRTTARQAVNSLVAAGRLRFVNDCGVSFLEKNYLGCHRISPHVMVSTIPEAQEPSARNLNTVVVKIMPGAAFGDCRHPTTRLSIRAVDAAICDYGRASGLEHALDIGTGSGILAVTAVRLGVKSAIASDIDACARKEAADNIALNGLKKVVRVSDISIPARPACFSMIMANLRPLTLKKEAPIISKKTAFDGLVILSGMKQEEVAGVVEVYRQWFQWLRREDEAGWSALILKKRGSAG